MGAQRWGVLLSLALLVGGCSSDGSPVGVADTPSTADGSESDQGSDLDTGSALDTDSDSDPGPGSEPSTTTALPGGLVACRDLPRFDVSEQGSLPTSENPEPAITEALINYGRERPESYAGYWIDRPQGGTVVLSFTDDPEPHRQAVRDLTVGSSTLPLGRRSDVAIDVVRVDFSEAELASVIDEVLQATIRSMTAVRVRPMINRVAIELFDPTPQHLEAVAAVAPVDKTCLAITARPPAPDGPLAVLPEPGADATYHCPAVPIEVSFLASALEDQVAVEDSDHSSARVLLDFLAEGPLATMPDFPLGSDGWIVLTTAENPHPATQEVYSLFVHLTGGVIDGTASTLLVGNDWVMSSWGLSCDLRLGLPPGLSDVEVFLDFADLPQPSSTSITVLVRELSCPGGELTEDRLRGPELIETDREVRVAFAAVKRYGTPQCEGSPMTSTVLELAAPLGDRTLIDATSVPPVPIAVPG